MKDIVIIVFIMVAVLCLIGLTISLIAYFNQRTRYFESEITFKNVELKNSIENNSINSYDEKMRLTNDLLDLIAYIVTVEINSTYQQLIALHTKYKIENLDNDVNRISTIVFNACRPAIERNNTLLD